MNMFEIKEFASDVGRLLFKFFSHRILWLMVITIVLFYILLLQLFDLQIVHGEVYRQAPPATFPITQPIPALRGTIYDRHGRPLATNELVFVVKIDPSVDISNEALLELALLFERNGESYIDDFPISREEPFEFTITGSTPDQIRRREHRWKDDMAVPNPWYATAEETWHFLRNERFDIDPELNNEDARRIMNFRSQTFRYRLHNWNLYNPTPILIAYNVSTNTIAAIEEQSHLFLGVTIEVEARRVYPAGHYVSHIIGYLRPITAAQLEANEHLGYTANDLFGRTGIELSMELLLRGTPGEQEIQVNRQGRRVGEPVRTVEPESGGRVFLTIDLALQQAAFYALEDALATTLINRLNRTNRDMHSLSPEDAFVNFMRGHNLDIRAVLAAEPDNLAFPMQRYILDRYPAASGTWDSIAHSNNIIISGIQARRISPAKMLLTLIGTGQITDPYGTIATRLTNQPNSARDILVQKIRERELTPQMMNSDPATGSIIITCVHTGQVLAAASYPTFDNNRLANIFDADYFHRINSLDPTHPMVNRPFRDAIAPGSTFKMFTGIAALEEGVINAHTRIFDGVAFTAAGNPPMHCWHRGGHGSINVIQAVAVSCNFFFAEAAFRLGNASARTRYTTLEGITRLNRYMEFFGFNDFSGVEIGNWPIDLRLAGFDGNTMASPDYKRYLALQRNPFAPHYALNWNDGDTIRVAIGQGYNRYSAAQMARAFATIATRGTNYELHLVSHVEDFTGRILSQTIPTPLETDIVVSDSTWDAIIEGMRLVTQPGAGGTATNLFRGFPIPVAGKTGTAEQIATRFSHSTFGAFAPLQDPQIAIYVSIPFGSTQAYTQIAARISQVMILETLGHNISPEHAQALNTLR